MSGKEKIKKIKTHMDQECTSSDSLCMSSHLLLLFFQPALFTAHSESKREKEGREERTGASKKESGATESLKTSEEARASECRKPFSMKQDVHRRALVRSSREAAASRLCAFEESFLTNCHAACRNLPWCHFQLERSRQSVVRDDVRVY